MVYLVTRIKLVVETKIVDGAMIRTASEALDQAIRGMDSWKTDPEGDRDYAYTVERKET